MSNFWLNVQHRFWSKWLLGKHSATWIMTQDSTKEREGLWKNPQEHEEKKELTEGASKPWQQKTQGTELEELKRSSVTSQVSEINACFHLLSNKSKTDLHHNVQNQFLKRQTLKFHLQISTDYPSKIVIIPGIGFLPHLKYMIYFRPS